MSTEVLSSYRSTPAPGITIETDGYYNGALSEMPVVYAEALDHYKSVPNLNELGYSGAYRPKSSVSTKFHGRKTSNKINRPKTAAAVLLRNDCDRLIQLQHEPTRRHNFESHLPTRKNKPPAWQKSLDPPLVPVIEGPGYVLSRSKSKCSMVLKEDFFDPPLTETDSPDSPSSPPMSRRVKADPERDNLISTLHQQVNDLTLYLEEERLNHKQTKQKAEELLKDKLKDLTNQYKNQLKDLQTEHKYNLKSVQDEKQKEFEEFKQLTDQKIHKLQTEIEFLQGAFESYKGTLEKETDGKWTEKEDILRQELEQEKTDAFVEFKTKILQEKAADKANLTKEFQRQKEQLKKDHRKEIEALVRRYATASADLEKTKKLVTELEEVKNELDDVKDSYKVTSVQLTQTNRMLTDTKVRLLEYEEQFNDKVQAIDDKYRQRIDDLMSQNTQLRQLYVKKCGQLFDEKSVTEKNVFENVTTAKKTMEELIKVKERSNVNLIANDPDLAKRARKPKTRPGSAPTTHSEGIAAHLSAGETGHLKQEVEYIRPDTTLPEPNPEMEQLRKELFSEDVKVFTKEDLLNILQS